VSTHIFGKPDIRNVGALIKQACSLWNISLMISDCSVISEVTVDVGRLWSCCQCTVWQGTAATRRIAFLVTVLECFVAYGSYREFIKLFRILPSPYIFTATCNIVHKCNLLDCTRIFSKILDFMDTIHHPVLI
jgi:hypothetical protein